MCNRAGLVVIGGLLAAGLWQTATAAEAQGEVYGEPGPYSVGGVSSIALQDWERATLVHTRVHYPEAEGGEAFPVIVFSHGLGGDKDSFAALGRHWASHGYVVLHPSHHDWGVRIGSDGLNPPAERIADRARDVEAAIELVEQLTVRVPELTDRLDPERVGVAGFSYGSFIAMLFAGVTAELDEDIDLDLGRDPVQCVVPIGTAGRGDYGLHDGSWEPVDSPALYINGTADVREGRAEDWRMEPYELSPEGGGVYQVLIEGADHGSFDPASAAGDAPHYVKAASLAFWETCLQDSDTAREWLETEEGFNRFAEGAATLSHK